MQIVISLIINLILRKSNKSNSNKLNKLSKWNVFMTRNTIKQINRWTIKSSSFNSQYTRHTTFEKKAQADQTLVAGVCIVLGKKDGVVTIVSIFYPCTKGWRACCCYELMRLSLYVFVSFKTNVNIVCDTRCSYLF